MTLMTLWNLETVPWYAAAVYWTISALRLKRTKVAESHGGRLWHIGLMTLAFALLFSRRLDFGLPGLRFLPQSTPVQALGILLTFVGAGVAIWARHSLGQYWSARVALKVDHRLIRSGLYAYVRHPLYAGLILAMVGTALVVGEWRALLGVLLGLMEFSRKAAKEEALLATEFSADYQEYQKHTGFLTPRLR